MRLGDGTLRLILKGVKDVGLDEVYEYLWEDLYVDEAEEVKEFIEFLRKKIGFVGRNNINLFYKYFVMKRGGAVVTNLEIMVKEKKKEYERINKLMKGGE